MHSLLHRLGLTTTPPPSQRPRHQAEHPQRISTIKGLDSLPPEIIQQITAFLPLSSAATLSLSNHALMHSLGQQYILPFRSLTQIPQQRTHLLQALDRDLPPATSFICYHCYKIHLLSPKRKNRRRFKAPPPMKPNEIFKVVEASECPQRCSSHHEGPPSQYHLHFCFKHVQMAMKLHQQGSHAASQPYLSHFSRDQTGKAVLMSVIPSHLGFRFFEPRIVDNLMTIRSQYWVFMPQDTTLVRTRKPLRVSTIVCAHLDMNRQQENQLAELVRCKLRHTAPDFSCDRCSHLIRCHYCPTEVQVEIKADTRGKPGGKCLILTTWQSMGEGISPFEAHWASRLQVQQDRFPWPWAEEDRHSPGRIKEAYEARPGTKWDAVLKAHDASKQIRSARKP